MNTTSRKYTMITVKSGNTYTIYQDTIAAVSEPIKYEFKVNFLVKWILLCEDSVLWEIKVQLNSRIHTFEFESYEKANEAWKRLTGKEEK